ncbi:MAG: DoxX family protein [Deltaproteobacteria bacterium]|nr:DoxX family protein [Deltaproteobacteria bacterium]
MKELVMMLSRLSGTGLALSRILLGAILALAGYQKVFLGGFFVSGLGSMGFPIPEILGPVVSLMELAGGVLLLLGLFTRYWGVVFTVEFIVATVTIAQMRGLMGARLEFLMVAAAFVLATNGGGILSLDRMLRREV